MPAGLTCTPDDIDHGSALARLDLDERAGGAARAIQSAPSPAITFSETATTCVIWRPTRGTSTKSVNRHPTAAPTALTP